MDRMTEIWTVKTFEKPYPVKVKAAIVVGLSEFSQSLNEFKNFVEINVKNVLNFVDEKFGSNISIVDLANIIIQLIPEITYVELSCDECEGVTVYREA